MKIAFDEQDVCDACCVFVARERRVRPESVQADVQFDRDTKRFLADTKIDRRFINGGEQRLYEQDIKDAISVYLNEFHGFIPESLMIDLQFSEDNGVEANIIVG